MAGLVGVLQSLGATRQRDGAYALDCSALQLGSMFGGDLAGPAVVVVTGEAITFKSPPELAACGKVWMTEVADEDTFCQALGVALDDLREQTRAALGTLRRLGFKARIQAPDPRARGTITREGHVIDVVVDAGGDLVVEAVDGDGLPTSQQASLMAPDEAEPDEVNQLLEQVLLGLAGGESTGIVPPALSEDELNELQAALSDDDDDDDGFDDGGDDERTAAGVPMPDIVRPAAVGPDDGSDDVDINEDSDDGDALDTGTVELPVQSAPVRPPPAPEAFDDDDDEPPTATLTTPIAKPLGLQPTVPVPPRPPTRQVQVEHAPDHGADDDGDPFDGVGEPTATRPVGRSTAVPPSIAPSRDDGGGLLDAFDDDDDDAAGADAFDDRPTSVRGADGSSVPGAEPVRRPAGGAFDDDDVASTGLSGLGADTGDDAAEGKTRALVIDADLLARLKRGDGDKAVAQQSVVPKPGPQLSALPTAPARPMPQRLEDEFDAPSTSATTNLQVPATRGEHEPPSIGPTHQGAAAENDDDSEITGAFAEAFDSGLDVAVDGPDDSDDGDASDEDDAEIDEATASVAVIPPRPTPRIADDEPGGEDDDRDAEHDADGFDDGTQNAPIPSASPGPAAEAELMTLQAKAVSLEVELQAVRARIEVLLRQREQGAEPTGTATARQPAPPQPRVGDSDEGEAPATAGNGGFTSLPSLQSVDVHEVKVSALAPPRSNSLLDDFDDEDGAAASGFDDGGAPPPARRPPPPPAEEEGEDVVSLAALQEELAQEGNATQVAASVMEFAPADDDDGDVFGSGGGGDSSLVDEESLASREAELSVEATRIRTSRLSSIALVVEDDRARDRLKKHLAERFSALIEAPDGPAILRMKGIADVDAIVFVRPRHDDANVGSLDRLESLPHRPRVLVISHDEAFDDLGAVDLRLPLGQRASEVAQQVIDGLERLGITLAPAA